MGDVVHGTVDANVSGQGSAVRALNTAGVMSVPNSGSIGASRHDPLAFRQAEETHERQRGHGGGREAK
jgi:hypothetical protein